MAKFEFITETNSVTLEKVYFTRKDGWFVDGSLSHDKQRAYDRFVNISSGVTSEPIIEVNETRYSITN